ncbi:cryptochrome/photolyase family protein [Agilicoccus flavus]|uniref:cryptochrome/photolyase family protein n=1 Tax=Agilicoccus flavus TaxID=2775968 RepID=UPI001CF63F23|nr:deoxyribodipyrimidine photo-lyase [Agilicoccus flavus]
MATTVLWLRRDLRLHDHPALHAAHEAATGGDVLPLFVLDPTLLASAGRARLASLRWALVQAHEEYDGSLVVRSGDPATVVPRVVQEAGASSVHVSGESTPYGRLRGRRVHDALGDVPMHAAGTPYAVSPGQVRTTSGSPYQVFTPFSRAWRDHGWPAPESAPAGLRFCRRVDSEGLDALPEIDDAPGQDVPALTRWREFLDEDLATYGSERDRADLDVTSRMSEHLKYGTIHPRTMLADIAAHEAGASTSAQKFVTELAWREFYADVVWHHPRSAWHDYRDTLAQLRYDDPETDGAAREALEAWCTGTTGYPFVDAGMRQLLTRGWVHNRVRMVVASFLTKDLHIWWPHGARHFLDHLRDGDLASNNHGWQWVAGTGTDASPYFRVFNPVTQGHKFDPDGDYVRTYVPELAHVRGKAVHEPWTADGAYDHGYPRPIVDHAEERRETLARYEAATA